MDNKTPMKTENQTTARQAHDKVVSLKPVRLCNLCEGEFRPRTKFERYCDRCRHESEIYHFADWLSA